MAGLGTFVIPSYTFLNTGTYTVPILMNAPLPQGTQFYNPMAISWKVAYYDFLNLPCSQLTNCQSAGTSSSVVYVTMATPSTSYIAGPPGQVTSMLPLPLTVLALAVGSGGATTPAAAFQNTWSQFSQNGGPANVKTWTGSPLYYYKSGMGFSCATTPIMLITAADGDGQCGSFASLFQWALAANGIYSSWVQVKSVDTTLMLIKDWQAVSQGSQGSPSPPYTWDMALNSSAVIFDSTGALTGYDMQPPPSASNPSLYGDLQTLWALPGQGTAPPSEKLFTYHFIVKLNNPSLAPPDPVHPSNLEGPYFDPSYGVWYSGNADFESKALWGYVQVVTLSDVWWVRSPRSRDGRRMRK